MSFAEVSLYQSIDLFKYREPQDIVEWCEDNIILSSKSSAQDGPYRFFYTPYLREIAKEIVHSKHQNIVIRKAAQLGITQLMINLLCYYQCIDPSPCMYVTSTQTLSEQMSTSRFDAVADSISYLRYNYQKDSARKKEFPSSMIIFAGAKTPVTFRSTPIKVLFLDEIDTYPVNIGDEGDPTMLAMARTRTFDDRKIVRASTPLIEGVSLIDEAFLDSDQRHFYCPCLSCGHYQVLEIENLRWNENNIKEAYFECKSCKQEIRESDKPQFLNKGKWIAHKKNGDFAGFQLNAFLSPSGWINWNSIVKLNESSRNNNEKMQSFTNTVLGKSHVDKVSSSNPTHVKNLMESSFKKGEVPHFVKYLTGAIDVQKDRLECLTCGWGPKSRTHVIEHEIIFGEFEKDEIKKQLDEWVWKTYKTKEGRDFKKFLTAVDAGYNTAEVYSFCKRHKSSSVIPIRGVVGSSIPFTGPRYLEKINVGSGRSRRWSIGLYTLSTDILKRRIYRSLSLTRNEIKDDNTWNIISFPKGFDDEFYSQLTAETLVRRKKSDGKIVESWVSKRDRNEILDLMVYNKGCSYIANIEDKIKVQSLKKKAKKIKRIKEKEGKDEKKEVKYKERIKQNSYFYEDF